MKWFPYLIAAFLLLCVLELAFSEKIEWGKWPPMTYEELPTLQERSCC